MSRDPFRITWLSVSCTKEVPEDIAITGFGDFEIARIGQPNLTTVDVGATEIGTGVGDLVAGLLFEDAAASVDDITLTPKLIVRNST